MSVPPPSQNQRPTASDYEHAVRGQGYTVPYKAPPPPPTGVLRRVKQYTDLRKKAQASSMAWWGSKVLQGCALSIIPLLIGAVLTLAYTLFGDGFGGALLGVLLLFGGAVVLGWYVLAPITCKWIVNVSENGYWVVEDGNGHTAEYLLPGRMIVPFRLYSKVHKYVTFQTVSVRETYDDVLSGSGQNVSMEIKVSMVFDPVNADSRLYARLRSMTQPEQFEKLVRNHVHDAVRRYFTLLAPRYWENALQHPKVLERAISDQLVELESMGLFLGSGQPVTVFVRGITISSGALAPPPDPERSRRDPLDLTPPPKPTPHKTPPIPQPARGEERARPYQTERRHEQSAPRRTAAPLPEQKFEAHPTVRAGQGGGWERTPPEPDREPPLNNQATMPHLHRTGDGNHQHDDTPPFIPGSFEVDPNELDRFDHSTEMDTLLREIRDSTPPKPERRARPSKDSRQPKSKPPDFWIKGHD